MVVVTAAGDVVVRLTPDPRALLEFLDTASTALSDAAAAVRAACPVPADDTDAPERWEPRVGDRVTVYYPDTTTVPDGSPATVTATMPTIHRAVVTLDPIDDFSEEQCRDWHCDYDELRPLGDEQPATVGPVPLLTAVNEALADNVADVNAADTAEAVADVFRERLAQYPADATAAQVFADWFGGDRG